ncbi:MAG TPA: EF-P lysine aminoacylase EpmA [Kofleriaceae bacterium]|nr:EF-P lysine aminoacylase EpmA [Kofleriaceae bacterium]
MTAASTRVRGRVIARDGDDALVRTERGDVRVRHAGAVGPGDLVELDGPGTPLRRVRAYPRTEYPPRGSEVARLGMARRGNLAARGRMMAALRELFASRDFIEVETPLWVPSPGLEVHLVAVEAGGAGNGWLITSPEYQMKRLLAGGMERIYQTCRCFRAGEDGPHHQREFTMLEWYRAWDSLDAIAADTEALVEHVARAVNGKPEVKVAGRDGARTIRVDEPWLRITVADAMREYAGVVVRGDETVAELAEAVRAAGVNPRGARHWDDVFFTAFVERVEPALAAIDRPLLLCDWPVPLGALARRKPQNPLVVERFEAYIGGIELANAFGELTDPMEQRSRFEDDLALRRDRGLAQYPLDEKLLAALVEGLPPCAGIALGVDRLAMLVLGAAGIGDVNAFATAEL